jgi:hypothetical protein
VLRPPACVERQAKEPSTTLLAAPFSERIEPVTDGEQQHAAIIEKLSQGQTKIEQFADRPWTAKALP